MERPAKRQRVNAPLEEKVKSLKDAFIEEDHVGNGDGAKEGKETLTDDDFHRRKSQNDARLKSTFDLLFEKYSQNFDGVADELDWEMEETLVDNGDIRRIRVEHGDESDSNSEEEEEEEAYNSEWEEPDELGDGEEFDDNDAGEGDIGEYGNEQLDADEGEDGQDASSIDDLLEDDMILRGFAHPSQFLPKAASPEMVTTIEANPGSLEEEQPQRLYTQLAPSDNILPSKADIFHQPEPQLALQAAIDVQRQAVERTLEESCDVATMSTKRSNRGSRNRVIQLGRSPSSGNYPLIWTARREKKGTRRDFTAEDEKVLLDFVSKVKSQQEELSLTAQVTWLPLAALVRLHSTMMDNILANSFESIPGIRQYHGRNITSRNIHIPHQSRARKHHHLMDHPKRAYQTMNIPFKLKRRKFRNLKAQSRLHNQANGNLNITRTIAKYNVVLFRSSILWTSILKMYNDHQGYVQQLSVTLGFLPGKKFQVLRSHTTVPNPGQNIPYKPLVAPRT